MNRMGPPRAAGEEAAVAALIDDLVLRTAWLLAATSVILGVTAQLHVGPVG
jgi:hypothetical protein